MSSKIIKRIQSNLGQHLPEYMMVLVVVMAAIILMGTYIFRSWNAKMKGYDESIKESYNDPLLEARPVNLSGCDCTDWEWTGQCGAKTLTGSDGKAVTCPLYYGFEQRSCTLNCNIPLGLTVLRCTSNPHPLCCSDWSAGPCGPDACCGASNDPSLVGPLNSGCTPSSTCSGHGCTYGYMNVFRFCGGATLDKIKYACMDPQPLGFSTCIFHCPPYPNDPNIYTGMCSGDDAGQIPPNTLITYVNEGACTDPTKCQVQCNAPVYFIIGNICDTCFSRPGTVNEGLDSSGVSCSQSIFGASAGTPADIFRHGCETCTTSTGGVGCFKP